MRLVIDERADGARGIASGRLDLDDVGAHVGEQTSGELSAVAAQVEDAQTRKRSRAAHLPRFRD